MRKNSKASRLLFTLALACGLLSAGVAMAWPPGGNGGGGGKPPNDDPPPPSISYSITFLGTLGGSVSEPFAMNERGDVVGRSTDGTTGLSPFVYFNDTGEMVDLRDLLTQEDLDLWNWNHFTPTGINSLGQISGKALKDGQLVAVRVSLPLQAGDASLVELVGPAEAVSSWASGINEFGDVTGGFELPGEIRRAFVYTDGFAPLDIGDLGGGSAHGDAINTFGEITGYSTNAGGERRAFLFTPGGGMQDLGIIKSAKNAIFPYSAGIALNDSAVVVGSSIAGTVKGTPVYHAFRAAGSGMDDLKTLGGDTDSAATGINSAGEIVGWSLGPNDIWRGFFYSDEAGMLAFNSLIDNLPADAADIYRWGIQINDAGEICGAFWFTDGTYEAFLMTPSP